MKKQKITKLLIPILLCLTLLLCLNLVSAAPGDTIYVNGTGGSDSWDGTSPIWTGGTIGPKATIQNGVNTVNSGGTVNVANGTYYEHITINKNLNLTGHSQDDTIIDGSGTGTVITINSGLIVGISNFTIQNGKADYGGGISNGGTCTITNCKITQNNATDGGGIYTYGNCIITGSSITQNNGRWGGGIENDGGDCKITNCNITQNSASYSEYSGYGGAIFNGGIGTCTITGSTIAQNNATYEGAGIFNNFNCTITDTNITQNNATGSGSYGGGIYNQMASTCTITSSSITGNTAHRGGGIYNQELSTCTITGSSITENTAYRGGGIYNFATFIAHFNRIFNNTATGAAFYGEGGTANATNNWWGNNTNPTTITDLIVMEGNSRINADPWLIMTFSTNPTTIIQGQTSNLIASFNTNSDNNTVGDANNHIPDGIGVTFTTDSGKVYTGSPGAVSKSVVAYTAGGVATAILDGDALLTASLDNQILTGTVIIIPGTNGTGGTTVNAATETTATGKTIGMQKTGLPIAGLVLAILAVFGGLASSKRK